MKKLYIVCILALSSFYSNGQLNPERNLYWNFGFYPPDYPWDTLTWNSPIPSTSDTLVGYNIYKDNLLMVSTIDTINSCDYSYHDSSYYAANHFCNLIVPETIIDCYFHVTAVYNQSHIESTYNDSVHFQIDVWPIGVKEIINEDLTISGIIQSSSSIIIELNQPVNKGVLIVSNCLGQLIRETIIQKEQKRIEIANIPTGFYFISLKTDKGYIVRKIIID